MRALKILGLGLLIFAAQAYMTIPVINQAPQATVTNLPSCVAASEGLIYIVTNALTPALSVAVVGGGAVHVQVTCINTAWKVTGL